MSSEISGHKECSVLVTGDYVTDHYLYEGRKRRSGSTIRLGTRMQSVAGGAGLLYDLLAKVATSSAKAGPSADFVSHFGLKKDEVAKAAANGYCLMRPHSADQTKSKKQIWRMHTPLGFDENTSSMAGNMANGPALDVDHDLVVIDDPGIEFRRWPSREVWPRFILQAVRELPKWLVLKMSSPV